MLTTIVSLTALFFSGLSTYLQFFHQRYRLTAAMVNATGSLARSASFDGAKGSVQFRHFARVEVLLSNGGTRPLVLTDMRARTGAKGKKPSGEPIAAQGRIEPVILEPKTAQVFAFEFLIFTEAREDVARDTAIPERREQVWLEATVYDHRAEALPRVFPAFDATTTYTPGDEGEYAPAGALAMTTARGPARLI